MKDLKAFYKTLGFSWAAQVAEGAYDQADHTHAVYTANIAHREDQADELREAFRAGVLRYFKNEWPSPMTYKVKNVW